MKKVCILLVLITYVYHNARFKKRKVFFRRYIQRPTHACQEATDPHQPMK